MSAGLETRGLRKSFGALTVADGIDFSLRPGGIHALIGPNGAGKSTFVDLLTGRVAPSGGRVLLDGVDVTGESMARRVKRGLVRTFQINSLFNRLTVLDNIALAIEERGGGAWRFRPVSRRRTRDAAMAILAPLGLDGWADAIVETLPHGRQRLVEIAIALACGPKVLLLDEPAAGVPSSETGTIIAALESLPPELAVLIIEHDMDLVFRLAQRITVLAQGAVLATGAPADIAADDRVREIYLGGGVDG